MKYSVEEERGIRALRGIADALVGRTIVDINGDLNHEWFELYFDNGRKAIFRLNTDEGPQHVEVCISA